MEWEGMVGDGGKGMMRIRERGRKKDWGGRKGKKRGRRIGEGGSERKVGRGIGEGGRERKEE